MAKAGSANKRPQTSGEEIANSISHGLVFLLIIVGLPVLIIYSINNKDVYDIIGASIFGLSLILLYSASTTYHILPAGSLKNTFQKLDHSAIFILIAGTYTPFALGVLRGSWGWSLFGLVWAIAITGIILELSGRLKHGKISNFLYLGMGWSVVLVIKPLITNMSGQGLFWLALGGLFYSGGVYFYARDRKKYFHFIWHLFVAAGSLCHYFAVLFYA